MKLHQDKKLFRQAIQVTSDQMQIPAVYVEKDYWVTFALFNIFNNGIGEETVFKGGTALSKCFGIIERFSEDIDLVVFRREGESNNQLTSKIKAIGRVVSNVLPEIEVEGLTQKMGMNRKTAHLYGKEFKGDYGQVRDVIIIEATWLGYFEPYRKIDISSFVGQMMIDSDQEDIATESDLLPFEVLVLEPTRTICEKIMSLVRFSYTDNPMDDLRNKIRHIYDLNQLLLEKDLLKFFNEEVFDKMLLKVAKDDVISFKNNNEWLANHPTKSIIFEDPLKIWPELKSTYESDFKNLVYGHFPEGKEMLGTLEQIRERLLLVDWNITI